MASFPPPQDHASYEDRRAYPRVPVALPAFLQGGGVRHSVQVIDLSAGGAKLSCALPLPSGSKVTLDCGTLNLGAVVRWLGPGTIGVAFDRQLDAREVAAMADRSRALQARMDVAR